MNSPHAPTDIPVWREPSWNAIPHEDGSGFYYRVTIHNSHSDSVSWTVFSTRARDMVFREVMLVYTKGQDMATAVGRLSVLGYDAYQGSHGHTWYAPPTGQMSGRRI